MPRYTPPRCQNVDLEDGRLCAVEMKPLGERHPLFGPNWKPGGWVFQCPRCEALRFIDEQRLDRYLVRTR